MSNSPSNDARVDGASSPDSVARPSEPTASSESGSPSAAGRLAALRGQIDQVDSELVRLLARRDACVREVGGLKQTSADLPRIDQAREQRLLADWRRRARAQGLSTTLAERVLREVLDYSHRAQESLQTPGRARPGIHVVYQGEAFAYGDLAATRLMATRHPGEVRRTGMRTFAETFDAVRSGDADYALLPIENSVVGGIEEVNALLADSELAIVDEEVCEVRHVLAAARGTRVDQVRRVRSHPMALAQCHLFLRTLDGAETEPYYDTAGAAGSIAEARDKTRDLPDGLAVICSAEAAEVHDLEILARDVADDPSNMTRFVLVGREPEQPPPGVPTKTSLAVLLDHRQGALTRFLGDLSAASLNLTRIESRPQPRTPWQYLFMVDFEGGSSPEAVAKALENAQRHCNFLRVLGTYPMRAGRARHLEGAEVAATAVAADDAPPAPAEPVAATPAEPEAEAVEREPRVVVEVGSARIGSDRFALISGPCAVESRAQMLAAAEMVRARGATILRGGAFKPRTSPHSFQGLGVEGLKLLAEAGRSVGLPVITEVLRIEDIDDIKEHADMLQIGARNMQNFALLRAVGRTRMPVLLKRGLSATVKELLSAADYILAEGNRQVVLCERGIRTFETSTRSTLDVAAVAVLKELSPLPVIIDPSHAAGRRELVVPLALAAAAAGADGLIVEAHPNPVEALCDKDQALTATDLDRLVRELMPILKGQGRAL
ncbi:MAG: 3-deoxy-7-phosphoheptulonate synthase [Planctomycetota bacterium]|nr:3-deoxy-7-phosphoheptulonate synthase [Planctomycetota bacterium]